MPEKATRIILLVAYSILPHQGDFRESGVIKQAYELNSTPLINPVKEMKNVDPLIEVNGNGIVIEAIKRSEDSPEAIVIRAFEAWGREVSASLSLGFTPESVEEVNLIEDEKAELDPDGRKISLDFSPFEIKSLKVFHTLYDVNDKS